MTKSRKTSAVYAARDFIKNLVAKIVPEKDYLKFGSKDDLPNKVIEILSDSGTASACIDRLDTFIQADGFRDEKTGLMPANPTQTMDDVLDDVSLYAAYFPAVALKVFFNAVGETAYIESVPVPHIRVNPDGTYRINRNFGTKDRKKNDDIILEAFNPSDTPKARLSSITRQKERYKRQVGQLYVLVKKSALPHGDKYGIPNYLGGIDDVKSDAALSTLEYNNIAKGWRAQVVLVTGEIDDETEDEDEKTDKDYFDDSVKKFVGEKGSQILHLEATDPENKPEVHILPIKEILNATDKATDRIANKVCRVLKVPPVLIGITTAGKLGDTQELKNQMELFRMHVNKIQRLITRAFETVTKGSEKFQNIDFTISSLSLFQYIPTELLNKLTAEQIAELFEITLPEAKTKKNELDS